MSHYSVKLEKKNYKISFSHRNKGFSSSEIPFLLNGVKFTPKVRCPRTLGEKKKKSSCAIKNKSVLEAMGDLPCFVFVFTLYRISKKTN